MMESTTKSSGSRSPFAGRPLARAPSRSPEPSGPSQSPALSAAPSMSAQQARPRRTPSMTYMENGLRWMEKQETRSLSQALADMDLEAERKMHAAAQDEAAMLVWKHQNPEAISGPYVNPDLRTRDYRSHLRKGSYHRSHSQDAHSSSGSHSASDGSQASPTGESAMLPTGLNNAQVPRKVSPPTGRVSVQKRRGSSSKSYDGLAEVVAQDIAIAHRRSSSGSKRIMSGDKKKFMSPDDRIWEDPEEGAAPAMQQDGTNQQVKDSGAYATQAQPSHVRRNPFARVRAQYEKSLERSNSAPALQTLNGISPPRHERVEIQRNPPSQSRNAFYTSNEVVLPPTPPIELQHEPDDVAPKTTKMADGREIRGDDIRAATSKSRSAYSPNLPRPTIVSDKPGRPIVSFQKDYKPKEIVMEEQHATALPTESPSPSSPQMGNVDTSPSRIPTKPGSSPFMQRAFDESPVKSRVSPRGESESPTKSRIPKINVSDVPKWTPSVQPSTSPTRQSVLPPVPTIRAPHIPHIPTICPPEEESTPVPEVRTVSVDVETPPVGESPTKSSRMSQRPSQAAVAPSPGRPLPRHANTTPIPQSKSTPHYTPSVRASSTLCAHCALPIAGRILSAAGERFHPGCFVCHQCNTNLECVAFYPEPERQRAARLEDPDSAGEDPALRFYCHLDFHELFSPRCKSCKTPIEGEVIVACGAEWHEGHFFCAQCGDPFDSNTPFVEKDGHAWCVGCHTNRYSSKCRKCKKPVTDVVVKALGSDWHSNCFTCMVSPRVGI